MDEREKKEGRNVVDGKNLTWGMKQKIIFMMKDIKLMKYYFIGEIDPTHAIGHIYGLNFTTWKPNFWDEFCHG
jgi:hypothetical protein